MFRIVFGILVNLISVFIWGKDKRRAFREKCFKLKENLGRLGALQAKLAEHDAMLLQQRRFITRLGGVLFSDVKRGRIQVSQREKALGEEQIRKEQALYRDLDEEAKNNLDEIIARRIRCAREDVISYDELYAEGDDKRQWRALQEFEQQILPCGNHYTYKHYKLPIDSFEPEVFLYKHGIHQLKTFKNLAGRAILDVGSFVGDSVLILRELSDSSIYSFEPDPTNYNLALRTLELNKHILSRGGEIVLENIGLGDFNGKEKITTPLHNGRYIGAASKLVGGDAKVGVDVVMRTLDSYVAEHDIQVGMIKVDIEGYEQRFLAGALETIKMQKPILLLSIYHSQDDFYSIKPFIESLNLGYRFDFFQGVNRWVGNDVMLLCEAV